MFASDTTSVFFLLILKMIYDLLVNIVVEVICFLLNYEIVAPKVFPYIMLPIWNRLRYNENFLIEMIVRRQLTVDLVPYSIRMKKDFVMKIVDYVRDCDLWAIYLDNDVIRLLLKTRQNIYRYLDYEYRNVVTIAKLTNGRILKVSGDNVRNHRGIVLMLMKSGHSCDYKYIGRKFKDDFEIANLALQEDGSIYNILSDKLKNDKRIVKCLIKLWGSSFGYGWNVLIPDKFLKKKWVLRMLSSRGAADYIRKPYNIDTWLRLVTFCPEYYKEHPPGLTKKHILAAFRLNPCSYPLIRVDGYRIGPDVVIKSVTNLKFIHHKICDDYKNNYEVLHACKFSCPPERPRWFISAWVELRKGNNLFPANYFILKLSDINIVYERDTYI